MCLTTKTGETIEVKYCVQESALRRTVGAAGIKVGAQGTALAKAIDSESLSMHPDLDKAEGLDLKLMSRGVASSLHIPVKLGDTPGTVNFWSTETNAFPPEAVKLLEQLVKKMAE
jgi:hypothetical protein